MDTMTEVLQVEVGTDEKTCGDRAVQWEQRTRDTAVQWEQRIRDSGSVGTASLLESRGILPGRRQRRHHHGEITNSNQNATVASGMELYVQSRLGQSQRQLRL